MCLRDLAAASHHGGGHLLILKSTADGPRFLKSTADRGEYKKTMKHFITIIGGVIISAVSYAQLNVVTSEEAAGYKTVWKAPMKSGCVRYYDGHYYLCGSTDNRYETRYATVLLGGDKESAILSLDDLYRIVSGKTKIPNGGLVVKGMSYKNTIICKTLHGLALKTEYVAGNSYILDAMRNKFDDAKKAINNFKEE